MTNGLKSAECIERLPRHRRSSLVANLPSSVATDDGQRMVVDYALQCSRREHGSLSM